MVGPGTRFLSGITYYTFALAEALSFEQRTSAILLRRLLPARLYPGGARVGADLSHLRLSPAIARFDGVDWFWLPSLLQALWFLHRRRPRTLLVQWWTAAALHTEIVLALAARVMGSAVVVELHEVIDPGEASRRWVRWYSSLGAPLLFRLAARHVVHSEHDRALMIERYRLDPATVEVVPHLVHDHYQSGGVVRPAPDDACNILCFGVIRPFKGVEDLVDAFDGLDDDEIDQYWLTVVGETWEGWTVPAERIARSRHRDRITFVNRYVTDAEVDGYFAGADAVALPYHRSSMSGPLHVAMSYGLPVVVTSVGGLTEAAANYAGAVVVEPRDTAGLREALRKVAARRDDRYAAPDELRAVAGAFVAVMDAARGTAPR